MAETVISIEVENEGAAEFLAALKDYQAAVDTVLLAADLRAQDKISAEQYQEAVKDQGDALRTLTDARKRLFGKA